MLAGGGGTSVRRGPRLRRHWALGVGGDLRPPPAPVAQRKKAAPNVEDSSVPIKFQVRPISPIFVCK